MDWRGDLGHRTVDPLLLDRLTEIDAVDRADDADDRELRAVGAAALDLLAERVPIGEVALHEVLVDHDDLRARRRVAFVEDATLQHAGCASP